MKKYAILILPAMNKVYYKSSINLAQAELEILNINIFDNAINSIKTKEFGEIPYITFKTEDLTDFFIDYISNLSSIYALFEIKNSLLAPVKIKPKVYFEDDIITIQKYSGKTNDYFTKLLLNTTIFSSNFGKKWNKPLNIFDPMCGRGTTLQIALTYGFNGYGIELSKSFFKEYEKFIKTYMRMKKLKHKITSAALKENKKVYAQQFELEAANNKEDYKSGNKLFLKIVNADTKNCGKFFTKEKFHIISVDLPYGIQVGSNSKTGSFTKNPELLLKEVLPGWEKGLKQGGTMGLAWNTNVLKRDTLKKLLESSGLKVFNSEYYQKLKHRVDQAIVRDVIIAKKI